MNYRNLVFALSFIGIGASSWEPLFAGRVKVSDLEGDPAVRAYAAWNLQFLTIKGDWSHLADKGMPSFIKALRAQDSDRSVKTNLCSVLSRFGPKAAPAVPAIAELLKEKDTFVRKGSAMALRDLGDTSRGAIGAIFDSLKDDDECVRIYSAGTLLILGKGDDKHLQILIDGLRTEDKEKIEAARTTFVKVGVPGFPGLLICLKDKSPRVRLSATGGFAGAFREIRSGNISVLQFFQFKHEIPDDTIIALAAATNDENVDVAANAIYALSVCGDKAKKAIPDIIKCLKDKRYGVRWSAACHLKEFGASATIAIPALTEALQDSEFNVRREAARSLEEIQSAAKK